MLLESNFASVEVEGEVSQPKQSRNGHVYFTLKDANAQLPCVIWGSTVKRSNILLEHGQQIEVTGDIQLYAPHGRYQLIVSKVKQAGLGALQQAFEKLKKKLQDEGLFSDSHKKPLPSYPKTIGVVTSATGAAFQDMVNTLQKRYPLVTLKLYHASVQGVNATPEIVAGIRYFNEQKNVDVIIIGRGGGSLEDLWSFNEEAVARAIHECEIPLISAVGHETDFSISDFVADVRAATPTQAAALAVPDINELRFFVEDADRRIQQLVRQQLQIRKDKVDYYLKNYALQRVQEKVVAYRNQLEMKKEQLVNRFKQSVYQKKESHQHLLSRLQLQDPNEPLKKGYTRIYQDGNWVRQSEKFNQKKKFEVEWSDGRIKL